MDAELVSTSARFAKYIQFLDKFGVNNRTRTCYSVRWSGTADGTDYFKVPCMLRAFIHRDGATFIRVFLYTGYGPEENPLGGLVTSFDVPLLYFLSKLEVTNPEDSHEQN